MQESLDVLSVCCNSLACDLFFTFSPSLAILGARPSKRKNSGTNSTNDIRRRKKAKAKSTVPSGTQVIDLVDAASGSTTSHSTANFALPSAATLQNPPSTSIASLPSCPTRPALSAPATVPGPVTAAQVSSTPTDTLDAPAHVPIHSSVPALSPNSSNPSSSLSPPTPTNETLPSQTVVSEGTSRTTTANSVICEPPAAEIALGEQQEQVQPRRVCYLSQTARRSLTLSLIDDVSYTVGSKTVAMFGCF